MNRIFLFGLILCFFSIFICSADETLIKPIEGSERVVIETNLYERYFVPVSMSEDKKNFLETQTVNGKVTKIFYELEGKTSKDIFDHYMSEFENTGFEIFLSGGIDEFGSGFKRLVYELNPWRFDKNYGYSAPFISGNADYLYYIGAKKNIDNGYLYVSIYTISGWNDFPVYRMDIVEENNNIPIIEKEKDNKNFAGFIKGSEEEKQEFVKFAPYNIVTSPLIEDNKFVNSKIVEGSVVRTYYSILQQSPFGIFAGFKDYLYKDSFEILYEAESEDIDSKFKKLLYKTNPWDKDRNYGDSAPFLSTKTDSQYYIISHKIQPEKTTYIIVYATAGWGKETVYRVDTIQTDSERPEIVSADAIKMAIEEKGKFKLYGILFRTGSYDILDISDQTLKIVAGFINADKEQKYYLVGHTDNRGDFDMNMRLSENRAKAIRDSLVNKYNVNADNIECHGVGPLYPVSSNDTEDGRKFNRRVEIVLQ